MPKKATSSETAAPAPAASLAPVTTTPPPSPGPASAPSAAPSGRPSCGYTLLIVILTVICTLIAEVMLAFALVAYVGSKITQSIENFSKPVTTSDGKPKELTKSQTDVLKSLGVDPKDLPPEIPADKVACAIEAVGETKVKSFIDGKETPGLGDLLKLRACL